MLVSTNTLLFPLLELPDFANIQEQLLHRFQQCFCSVVLTSDQLLLDIPGTREPVNLDDEIFTELDGLALGVYYTHDLGLDNAFSI